MKFPPDIYISDLQQSVNRMLSHLNIDLNSTSAGSFDRSFWGWKRRDFQDSTLSGAYLPLQKGLHRLENLINIDFFRDVVLQNINLMQYNNGSFDQAYPYDGHPKVGFDFTEILYSYLIRNQDAVIRRVYKKLIHFGLKDESYAIICNHLAHQVHELLQAAHYFNEQKYYDYAIDTLKRIASNTDEEGWHTEYLGGDPGYQSRTLKYLVRCMDMLHGQDRTMCENLCINSIKFLSKLIMPDGTLYPMFGSRNTALLYPSGIEYMAKNYPEICGTVARRVRKSVLKKYAVTPLDLDFDNFLRLFDDFLDAQNIYEQQKDISSYCSNDSDSNNDEFDLVDFGFMKRSQGNISLFVHYKYGGAVAIYKNDELLYKNAGYLIEVKNGEYLGTRNLQILSILESRENDSIELTSTLLKSIDKDLTPLQFVILRMLNLTLLRIGIIGDCFRKIIIKKIIIGNRKHDLGLFKRNIKLLKECVRITDNIELNKAPNRIFKVVNLHLFHMASSRYHYPVDRSLKLVRECTLREKENYIITESVEI